MTIYLQKDLITTKQYKKETFFDVPAFSPWPPSLVSHPFNYRVFSQRDYSSTFAPTSLENVFKLCALCLLPFCDCSANNNNKWFYIIFFSLLKAIFSLVLSSFLPLSVCLSICLSAPPYQIQLVTWTHLFLWLPCRIFWKPKFKQTNSKKKQLNLISLLMQRLQLGPKEMKEKWAKRRKIYWNYFVIFAIC